MEYLMYTNIFKAARQGKLLVAKDGVKILGRVYKKGDPVKFRVNMNRMTLKKLLQLELLVVADDIKDVDLKPITEAPEAPEQEDTVDEPTQEPVQTEESDESEEEPEEGSEDGSDSEVGEGSDESDSSIEESIDATESEEVNGSVIELDEDVKINQGNPEAVEEQLEGDLDGSEVQIEESLTVPTKEELDAMTIAEVRVITNPLGLKSNSKEKLVEQLLEL